MCAGLICGPQANTTKGIYEIFPPSAQNEANPDPKEQKFQLAPTTRTLLEVKAADCFWHGQIAATASITRKGRL